LERERLSSIPIGLGSVVFRLDPLGGHDL